MATNQLYDAWKEWLEQLFPNERVTRVRTIAAALMGLYRGKSVHLSKIASEVPGCALLLSQERRMSRLLDNPAFNPKRWYRMIACWWLTWCAHNFGELVLIVDGTKVSANHQLLMVALALKGRALPIAWTWVKGGRGHSSRSKQLALLARVHGMVPPGTAVTLVGDSEFGSVDLMQHIAQEWHWNYVLHQKSNNQVRPSADAQWQDFDRLVMQSGSYHFIQNGYLTEKHAYQTNLLAVWQKGEKQCWLLASSFSTMSETMRYYRQRMLIEQMFGDFKGHGFDLEHTRLRHFQRLGRLTLLVCLLYVWLIRTGLMLVISRRSNLVDRNDRRDLCLFQLGVRYIRRLLNNNDYFRIRLCPDNLYDIMPCDQIKLSGS